MPINAVVTLMVEAARDSNSPPGTSAENPKGDRLGNLVYRKTARNFNPAMATAADLTIAEVEELVEPGELDPDHIVTPGIYVNRILVGAAYRKPIESKFIQAGIGQAGGAA